MQVNLLSIIMFLVVTVVTVAVTFYVKDYLQTRSEYRKLRKKLEKIAGRHATILYSSSSLLPRELFKIDEIDEEGITVKNELQTIFIPAKKLLQSDMVLPVDNYEAENLKKTAKNMEQNMEVMMPIIFEKMFPALMSSIKDSFFDEMLEEEGEVNAVIGIKIQKVLSEEGFEIKKKEPGKLIE